MIQRRTLPLIEKMIKMIREDKTNREIALELSISIDFVESLLKRHFQRNECRVCMKNGTYSCKYTPVLPTRKDSELCACQNIEEDMELIKNDVIEYMIEKFTELLDKKMKITTEMKDLSDMIKNEV